MAHGLVVALGLDPAAEVVVGAGLASACFAVGRVALGLGLGGQWPKSCWSWGRRVGRSFSRRQKAVADRRVATRGVTLPFPIKSWYPSAISASLWDDDALSARYDAGCSAAREASISAQVSEKMV